MHSRSWVRLKMRSAVTVLVIGVLGFAVGSLFDELQITTPKSPYSQGDTALFDISFACDCGRHATNTWLPGNTLSKCVCEDGYVGTPPKCRPGPELWNLCFKDNPCGVNSECKVENDTRSCSCLSSFEGDPPHCLPGRLTKRYCPGDDACGPASVCFPSPKQACYCLPDFIGDPPNCTAGPALLSHCNPYPCGGYSDCRIRDGAPVCSCLPGYVGTPPDCKPGPEMWRVCFKDSPCGFQAQYKCEVEDRASVCTPYDTGNHEEPVYCD